MQQEGEEGLSKLQPANKNAHVCQSWHGLLPSTAYSCALTCADTQTHASGLCHNWTHCGPSHANCSTEMLMLLQAAVQQFLPAAAVCKAGQAVVGTCQVK